MRTYRICCMGDDGRISRAVEAICRDDMAALAQGEKLCGDSSVEIWHAGRLVARVKPRKAPVTPEDARSP